MGCLMVLFGLLTPRFVMLVLWIFTDYLSAAFGGWFWPTLGFFLLPTTTIAYAIAQNEFSTPLGGVSATGIIVIVLGVLVDFGLFGAGARGRGIGRHPGRDS
jgi:hypothetical protein